MARRDHRGGKHHISYTLLLHLLLLLPPLCQSLLRPLTVVPTQKELQTKTVETRVMSPTSRLGRSSPSIPAAPSHSFSTSSWAPSPLMGRTNSFPSSSSSPSTYPYATISRTRINSLGLLVPNRQHIDADSVISFLRKAPFRIFPVPKRNAFETDRLPTDDDNYILELPVVSDDLDLEAVVDAGNDAKVAKDGHDGENRVDVKDGLDVDDGIANNGLYTTGDDGLNGEFDDLTKMLRSPAGDKRARETEQVFKSTGSQPPDVTESDSGESGQGEGYTGSQGIVRGTGPSSSSRRHSVRSSDVGTVDDVEPEEEQPEGEEGWMEVAWQLERERDLGGLDQGSGELTRRRRKVSDVDETSSYPGLLFLEKLRAFERERRARVAELWWQGRQGRLLRKGKIGKRGRRLPPGLLVDALHGDSVTDWDENVLGGELSEGLTEEEMRLVREAIERGGPKGSWLQNMMRVWGRR